MLYITLCLYESNRNCQRLNQISQLLQSLIIIPTKSAYQSLFSFFFTFYFLIYNMTSFIQKSIKRVAIIGGGPGGIAAARAFRNEGAFETITIFERNDHSGGTW